MANRRRDAAKERCWRDAVRRQVASGLNVRAFCRREALAESAFHAWRRTIAERDATLAERDATLAERVALQGKDALRDAKSAEPEATSATRNETSAAAARSRVIKPRAAQAPAFVPAVVTGVPRGDGAIAIELAGGLALRLPEAIDAARLAELVVALEMRGAR